MLWIRRPNLLKRGPSSICFSIYKYLSVVCYMRNFTIRIECGASSFSYFRLICCFPTYLICSTTHNLVSMSFFTQNFILFILWSTSQDDSILVMPTVPGPPPKLHSKGIMLDDFRARAFSLLAISGMSGCCQVLITYQCRVVPGMGKSLTTSYLSHHCYCRSRCRWADVMIVRSEFHSWQELVLINFYSTLCRRYMILWSRKLQLFEWLKSYPWLSSFLPSMFPSLKLRWP